MSTHPDIERVIFDEETILKRVKEMGAQIAADYKDLKPLLLVVLRGSFMFASDLSKAILPVPEGLEVDFVRASSYAGTESTATIEIDDEDSVSEERLAGRHVLLVEDIVDTGLTCSTLVDLVKGRGASSVKTIGLLDKAAKRRTEFKSDYIGFDVENVFVVGYGLDYNQAYRTLPYVGVLKAEKYM